MWRDPMEIPGVLQVLFCLAGKLMDVPQVLETFLRSLLATEGNWNYLGSASEIHEKFLVVFEALGRMFLADSWRLQVSLGGPWEILWGLLVSTSVASG